MVHLRRFVSHVLAHNLQAPQLLNEPIMLHRGCFSAAVAQIWGKRMKRKRWLNQRSYPLAFRATRWEVQVLTIANGCGALTADRLWVLVSVTALICAWLYPLLLLPPPFLACPRARLCDIITVLPTPVTMWKRRRGKPVAGNSRWRGSQCAVVAMVTVGRCCTIPDRISPHVRVPSAVNPLMDR